VTCRHLKDGGAILITSPGTSKCTRGAPCRARGIRRAAIESCRPACRRSARRPPSASCEYDPPRENSWPRARRGGH